jgi:hypothetical protein
MHTLDPFLKGRLPDPDAVVKSSRVGKSISDNDVRDAWNAAHPNPQATWLGGYGSAGYVQEIVMDEYCVIVNRDGVKYRVPYSVGAGEVAFDDASAVRVKESWQPVGKYDAFLADPDSVAKQAPPGPRVIELDADQDSVARVLLGQPGSSALRPGAVGGDLATSEPLLRPAGVAKAAIPGVEEHVEVLSDHRWTFHANDHDSCVYAGPTPEHEGHEVRVWDSGNWIHYDGEQKVLAEGRGAGELEANLVKKGALHSPVGKTGWTDEARAAAAAMAGAGRAG